MLTKTYRAMVQEWYFKRREVAANMKYEITDWVANKVQKRKLKCSAWFVNDVNQYQYQVLDGRYNREVNFMTGLCECRKWQLSGILCGDVIDVTRFLGLTYCVQFVAEWFKKEKYQGTYAESIHFLGEMQEWKFPSHIHPVIPLQMDIPQPGRPKIQTVYNLRARIQEVYIVADAMKRDTNVANEKNYLSMSRLITSPPGRKFVGGLVATVDPVELDSFSSDQMKLILTNCLGYNENSPTFVYMKKPNCSLDSGLVPLADAIQDSENILTHNLKGVGSMVQQQREGCVWLSGQTHGVRGVAGQTKWVRLVGSNTSKGAFCLAAKAAFGCNKYPRGCVGIQTARRVLRVGGCIAPFSSCGLGTMVVGVAGWLVGGDGGGLVVGMEWRIYFIRVWRMRVRWRVEMLNFECVRSMEVMGLRNGTQFGFCEEKRISDEMNDLEGVDYDDMVRSKFGFWVSEYWCLRVEVDRGLWCWVKVLNVDGMNWYMELV
ncbi:hypothetical protein Tco_1070329 [Tanacetum coccineum]|uniref:SWIM-type domain-containing protein n=1 Tax=Tanacetum coccineum TaxID=301880 RepID=A0ABQ5HMV0_9ASTR